MPIKVQSIVQVGTTITVGLLLVKDGALGSGDYGPLDVNVPSTDTQTQQVTAIKAAITDYQNRRIAGQVLRGKLETALASVVVV